jgi:hypothetical protein
MGVRSLTNCKPEGIMPDIKVASSECDYCYCMIIPSFGLEYFGIM